MSFIDLHVHTTASDGTLSPKEVVEYGIQKELSVMAITDHDTIAGIEEAVKTAKGTNLSIVPGVELACIYKGIEIHMLGFFLDWKNDKFARHLSDMREKREKRNEKMIEKMQKGGIAISMDKLIFEEKDTVITRGHFARFLEAEGYVKSKQEAFDRYIGIGCPYYLPREYIDPVDAISWIHEAGGLAFLAHPYLYGFTEGEVKKMLSFLKATGLDGLEAYHSSTSQGQVTMLRQYAKEMKLMVSGGSDFHGSNKPDVDLGCGKGNLRITHYIYEKIKTESSKKLSACIDCRTGRDAY